MPNVAISCIAEMTALPRELHSTYVKTIPPPTHLYTFFRSLSTRSGDKYRVKLFLV